MYTKVLFEYGDALVVTKTKSESITIEKSNLKRNRHGYIVF